MGMHHWQAACRCAMLQLCHLPSSAQVLHSECRVTRHAADFRHAEICAVQHHPAGISCQGLLLRVSLHLRQSAVPFTLC